MKPIRLEMQGFGPFGGTEIIEFSQLSGVFLITGDTGAGKTTIFDGISFALFGETSGSSRQVDSVRSHYAEATEPTRVWLKFSQHGEEYEIERSPRYERPRKNGKGTTTELPKAAFTLPDGTVLTGKETVNRKVEELLGLNYKQFKQVAMIAQGEFLQLLLAGSEQRGAIFRKVFHTEDCQYLQTQLKTRVSEARAEVERNKTQILSVLQMVQPPCHDTVGTELEEAIAQKDPYRAKNLMQGIKGWIEADDQTRTDLEEQEKQLIHRLEQLRALQKQYAQLQQAEERLQAQRQKISQQQEALEQARKVLESAADKEEKIKEYNIVQAQLEEKIKSRARANELGRKLQEAQRKAASKQEQQALRHKQYEQWTELLQKDEARVQELSQVPLQLGELRAQSTQLEHQLVQMRRAQNLEELCKQLKNRWEKQQLVYLQVEQDLAEARTAHQTGEDLWFRAQAGILAQTLVEGQACPVCGSIHHPDKAKLEDHVPSEAERKLLRSKVEELQKRRGDESVLAAEYKSTYEAEMAHLQELDVSLTDMAETEKAASGAKRQIRQLELQQQELTRLQQRLPEHREKMVQCQSQEEQARQEAAQCQVEAAGLEGALRQEVERFGSEPVRMLQEQLRICQSERGQLEKALSDARHSHELLDRSLQQ
ncbi:MAG: SMC family ATPase, partial [Firmicutes bacterium]|nr:SMC family ATPase [Bacillota bacterium]